MKTSRFVFFLFIIIGLSACSSIRVTSDYEAGTDFSQYKSFAFYKTGVDKAPISDIDKRRILKSIETELFAKGLVKSETPDVLVSIFTKAREQVDIYEPRWTPYYYNPFQSTQISKYTEGTLFIDLIDPDGKKLIWQGIGNGFLTKSSSPEKREANIQLFVKEILEKFPPVKK
jgi:hypothetical protein